MSKKPILFENNDSDSDVDIKTNNDYATNYNIWRKKEEFNKLKTKYGDPVTYNLSDNDESSSSDEDEDGRELTEEFEKDFFKTLACLKNKDPKIYDDKVIFFENKNDENNTNIKRNNTKKDEPMFLKDYERKMILEKGAKFEESDEDELEEDPRSNSPTYVEEQRRLKESLKKALDDNEEDGENWGGLFSKRQKTKEEQEQEEEDYKKWLKGKKQELENKDDESALKPLKEYWSKPELDASEKFLRDYFLNKRYLEKENDNHIPTYEEIIHDSDEGLSEDEKQIEKQEEFEHKYNFRFEEPDQEFIKRYPRTMENSVRKTDDRRKLKRQEIKQRKEEEKKQKQEELKQLKILKREEIEEKIKTLKEITGNNDMAFEDDDLNADFDPELHDRRMQQLFDEQYYQGEEGDEKPEFSDFEEELGPWKDSNEPHCEDDDFIMDADYDPTAAKQNKKEKKKRNRHGKTTKNKKDLDELPIDENDARYQEYMDELYKLDCEDMIGDMPCRFKYREVLPNDFGLSVEEILIAKEKELNRWCSLKKTMQYRPEHMEKYDVIAYKRKAMNEQLKRKLLPSIYDENLLAESEEKELQVSKMNKHKNFDNLDENHSNNEFTNEFDDNAENKEVSKKDKKNKKNKLSNKQLTEQESNTNNEVEGDTENKEVSKTDKKNKKKKVNNKQLTEQESNINNEVKDDTENRDVTKKDKKNKKQNNEHENEVKGDTKNKEVTNKDKKNKNKIPNNEQLTDNDKNVAAQQIENVEINNSTKKKKPSKAKIMRKIKKREQLEIKLQKSKVISEQIKAETIEEKLLQQLTRRQKKNRKSLTKKTEQVKETKKRKLSTQEGDESTTKNPKKKPKFNNKKHSKIDIAISDSRLEAYGINPKKYKNKLKYKNQNN